MLGAGRCCWGFIATARTPICPLSRSPGLEGKRAVPELEPGWLLGGGRGRAGTLSMCPLATLGHSEGCGLLALVNLGPVPPVTG